jgi:hypothetical protein
LEEDRKDVLHKRTQATMLETLGCHQDIVETERKYWDFATLIGCFICHFAVAWKPTLK